MGDNSVSVKEINIKLETRRNSDNSIVSEIINDWAYYEKWFSEGTGETPCNRYSFYCNGLGISKDQDLEDKTIEDDYSLRVSDNDTGDVLYSEF